MHHSIGRIIGKITDYKICYCSAINWYENEECIICGNDDFREPHENEGEKILADFNYDEECVIDI